MLKLIPLRALFTAAGCAPPPPPRCDAHWPMQARLSRTLAGRDAPERNIVLGTNTNAFSRYNDEGIWNWNVHDGDWIYQVHCPDCCLPYHVTRCCG